MKLSGIGAAFAISISVFGLQAATITGNITSPDQIDLFQLTVTDPSSFFVSSVNSGTTLDTVLALFTTGGLGLVANDDTSVDSTTELRAELPIGIGISLSLPVGVYQLAVTSHQMTPFDASGTAIFPFLNSPGLQLPNGLAGPLDHWDATNPDRGSALTGPYTLLIGGAAVPEPTVGVMIGVGLLTIGVIGGRIRRRRDSRIA